jgi:leucyl-tRNA synthetase
VEKHAPRLQGVEIKLDSQIDLAKCTPKEKSLVRKTHQTLKRVTNDFESRWHFNTSVALVMELVNELQAQEPLDVECSPLILKRTLAILALMLSPMTPHIAEEVWQMLGNPTGLTKQKWPTFREDLTREEQLEVIIQINGRLRGKTLVDDGLSKEETQERAVNDPRIAPLIVGKEIVKVIVVPGKLVNIVLK